MIIIYNCSLVSNGILNPSQECCYDEYGNLIVGALLVDLLMHNHLVLVGNFTIFLISRHILFVVLDLRVNVRNTTTNVLLITVPSFAWVLQVHKCIIILLYTTQLSNG